MILGALVVNVTLEVLRTPNHATWVFFILILATLVAKLRPWWLLGAVLGSTIVFGFAVYGIADAIDPTWTSGTGAVTGRLGEALSHWTPIPPDPMQIGNYAFVALTAGVLALTVVRPLYRNLLLPVVALPRRLRLERAARLRAEHDPADHDRRDPDRADERPAAGAARADAGWRSHDRARCSS